MVQSTNPVVYINGWDTSSSKFTIALADADTPATLGLFIIGGDIANNASGSAYGVRLVSGIDTSAAAAVGSKAYLSATAGAVTFTAPTGADQVVQDLGVVVTKAVSGSIYFTPAYSKVIAAGTSFFQNNSVSNAKAAQMATLTLKGNNTGGTANASDLTVAQVLSMLGLPSVSTIKQSCRAATTAALPANTMAANVLTATANGALPAQDGVTLVLNERLLVKDEATGANNGPYYVSQVGDGSNPWKLTRATDANSSAMFAPSQLVPVDEGTVSADTIFKLTNNGTITLNTTALVYQPLVTLPKDYGTGFLPSYASATSISFTAGKCRDSSDSADIVLSAAMAGSLSGTWVAGTGANKLDTGSVAANTTYFAYAIKKDSTGVGDWILSTNATNPAMPSGYTYYRQIFAIRTNGSSQFVNFVARATGGFTLQVNLDVPVEDINVTNPGTAAVSRTLSVPTGIPVRPIAHCYSVNVSTNYFVLITSLDQTDTTPSTTIYSYRCTNADGGIGTYVYSFFNIVGQYRTNTSGQIRSRQSSSGASDPFKIVTFGWFHDR